MGTTTQALQRPRSLVQIGSGDCRGLDPLTGVRCIITRWRAVSGSCGGWPWRGLLRRVMSRFRVATRGPRPVQAITESLAIVQCILVDLTRGPRDTTSDALSPRYEVCGRKGLLTLPCSDWNLTLDSDIGWRSLDVAGGTNTVVGTYAFCQTCFERFQPSGTCEFEIEDLKTPRRDFSRSIPFNSRPISGNPKNYPTIRSPGSSFGLHTLKRWSSRGGI